MNLSSIVHRAIDTTRRYKSLWIVGFLWALAGGGGGGGGGGNVNFGSDFPDGGRPDLGRFGQWTPSGEQIVLFLAIVIPLILLYILIASIVHYVLSAGTYRGLDMIEGEGWVPTVRGVWRLGWQGRTWRLFFGDLLIGIPTAVIAVASLIMVFTPLLLLIADNDGMKVLAIVLTICFFLAWLLAVIVVAVILGLAKQIWSRAAVVDDLSLFDAIGTGFGVLRANLGELAKAWFLMLVLSIAFTIIFVMAFFVVLAVAAAVAGLPAYLIYQRSGNLAPALLYGIPVGLLIIVIPSALIQGLYLIFDADVWSLIYRELPRRPGLPPVRWPGTGGGDTWPPEATASMPEGTLSVPQ